MDKKRFDQYRTATYERVSVVEAVASLRIIPGQGRNEHVLAAIDTMNRYLGRPATPKELQTTLADVIKNRLWDIDALDELKEPYTMTEQSVEREILGSIRTLDINGLINYGNVIGLSPDGESVLEQISAEQLPSDFGA